MLFFIQQREDKILKSKRKMMTLLIMGILAPIGFVVGIPLIIFGAMNEMIFMVIGIVLVVVGFYGTPIFWLNYASAKFEYTIYELVTVDHVLSIRDLAESTGKKEIFIQNCVYKLIHERDLSGYTLKNGNLELNLKKRQEHIANNIKSNKCPNCNAFMNETSTKFTCPYCGISYAKNNQAK